ncbi:hypothetical protein O5D80_001983 [Batrachochytrium dendrobatidis]|nr:hypothetical protein O5D80_001983 [Batrachochytrium dendrobatidis]
MISQHSVKTDPLYNWKPHSGFKMGLLTDIVLGDSCKYSSANQPCSTTHAHYQGVQIPPTASTSISSCSKSKAHVVFGDPKMVTVERNVSLTGADYKPPPLSTSKPVLVKPGVLIDSPHPSTHTVSQMYHSKTPTATSAAHIGLKTRQNLPIDDMHFKNFITTSQDAYPLKDIASLSITNAPVYKSSQGRPSHIHLGDLGMPRSYSTVQNTSFVNHPSEVYKPYNGHHQKSSSLTLGYAKTGSKDEGLDQTDMYTTTTGLMHKDLFDREKQLKMHPDMRCAASADVDTLSKQSGASHIVFGEVSTTRRKTEPSVTQRDYNYEMNDTNFDPTVTTSVRLDHNRSTLASMTHGIISAIEPDVTKRELESHSSSTFKPCTHLDLIQRRAAGTHSMGGSTPMRTSTETSSVPTGDPRHFTFGSFTTTSASAYPKYNTTNMPTHPILGENMTKSKVTFGEQDEINNQDVVCDRYTTTSQTAFPAYSKNELHSRYGIQSRPHSGLKSIVESSAGMANNYTCHQTDYPMRSIMGRRHTILPQLAKDHLLFPLCSKRVNSYETTTQECFAMRDGLAEGKTLGHVKTLRDSSIVFGDPLHVNFTKQHVYE